jgi:di/tripeptidase
MVCEKNADKVHDFFQDPLTLVLDGDWLKADGTTLGADNGLGVATALALLDMPASTPLPPLECLFTVDEETGLTGSAPDVNYTRIITLIASTCTIVVPPTPDATEAQHDHRMHDSMSMPCCFAGA